MEHKYTRNNLLLLGIFLFIVWEQSDLFSYIIWFIWNEFSSAKENIRCQHKKKVLSILFNLDTSFYDVSQKSTEDRRPSIKE